MKSANGFSGIRGGSGTATLSWRQVDRSIVRIDADVTAGPATFLLRGDAHHDNPHSDHEKQKQDLDEALRRNAGIIDCGDLFCAMGGRADPRRTRAGVTRPEHAEATDYFDSLVRHNAEFLRPYAKNIIGLGMGNHETAIRKNQETDLTARLVERLNTLEETHIASPGYGAYYHLRLQRHNGRAAAWIHVFHGSGGGGLMTFDTLRVRRQASFHPMADAIVCGHVHERWSLEMTRVMPMNRRGIYAMRHLPQWHVRTGTYKQEFDMAGGFHFERGSPPKPIGGMWMTATMIKAAANTASTERESRIQLTFTPT